MFGAQDDTGVGFIMYVLARGFVIGYKIYINRLVCLNIRTVGGQFGFVVFRVPTNVDDYVCCMIAWEFTCNRPKIVMGDLNMCTHHDN